MGGVHQFHRFLRRQALGFSAHLHREEMAARLVGVKADLGGHFHVPEVFHLFGADRAEGALEAGGIARREELFGVSAPAGAAHFHGPLQFEIQYPVRGADVAGAAAMGRRRSGIFGLQGRLLFSTEGNRMMDRMPALREKDQDGEE